MINRFVHEHISDEDFWATHEVDKKKYRMHMKWMAENRDRLEEERHRRRRYAQLDHNILERDQNPYYPHVYEEEEEDF